MPELRVVLLGSSWSDKSLLGNLLLGETIFSTEEELNIFVRFKRKFNETEIVLVNTPDLLHPNMTQKEHVEKCIEFSFPGPHVFLLVLNPENFTEKHKKKLESFFENFCDQQFKHSLAVIKLQAEKSHSTKTFQQNLLLRDTVGKCRATLLWEENLLQQQLLSTMGSIVKENNGDYLSLDIYKEPTSGILSEHQARRKLNQGGLVGESLNPVTVTGKYKNIFHNVINTKLPYFNFKLFNMLMGGRKCINYSIMGHLLSLDMIVECLLTELILMGKMSCSCRYIKVFRKYKYTTNKTI